ncbi:MotA/TolQ/ExbB proton channel family protein [Colwellia sp. 1_MG-2023]|uniref:MotA/TolQ/ExbB proton channel family protein n=1 Tax=unclassified Colwellia TaxID=196834 RepID=UPI001C095B6B|nr:MULTISPECIES: MotA/TolQ/ExbB proton channel family protein [unclassified Colwellia]MBU2923570.1 MotA/TolQ/ExbB proton channel family protein [Colwellia sp. C2M11]MDO6653255.1 MotA/TolQ/ExbB proton channel family protein [Colwellia sp. 3_MG-2023]MDO6664500.1 MotA/TolQ/ExbB proton channel family protein [Colwellia sp. 2_MG-2023]MDO6688851.1 MotA/TolQ/ExbB proton channel family protein [Colwellia sp. 1_MG-2023]
MSEFESVLYDLTRFFLFPIMSLILISLAYSLLALGGFIMEFWQRKRQTYASELASFSYTLIECTSDDLELWILKRLENLRIVTRTSPMLGLVATMISIGPALLALGEGQVSEVSSNMVVAFSAVILSLIAASITFAVLTVKRRFLLEELRGWERTRELKEHEHALS